MLHNSHNDENEIIAKLSDYSFSNCQLLDSESNYLQKSDIFAIKNCHCIYYFLSTNFKLEKNVSDTENKLNWIEIKTQISN